MSCCQKCPVIASVVTDQAARYLQQSVWVGKHLYLGVFREYMNNWQLLFLNQWKRENGRRNVFMTKSPRKNVPDVGIQLRAACMWSGHYSDRATTPSISTKRKRTNIATENQFLHFEFHVHALYGDVLTLKNVKIRGKVLFDSTAEYRVLRS